MIHSFNQWSLYREKAAEEDNLHVFYQNQTFEMGLFFTGLLYCSADYLPQD